MVGDEAAIGEAWTLANFSDTIHRGGVGLWAWSPTRRLARLDALCREFWDTPNEIVGIDELFARVNAEDRDAMMHDWMESAADPQPYSFDFRIGDGSDALWISARGVGGDAGRVGEWVHAIFMDVTNRKRAEEAERLLTAEMAHRVSNMFTVARALTAIVAREATSTSTFADDLTKRFSILHDATTLATRAHKVEKGDVRIGDLAERILAPYREGTDISIEAANDAVVASAKVNDYAMILHELATNSAKYGALSNGGTVRLQARTEDGLLRLSWNEGPGTLGTPKADGTGFGSRLLRHTIERSLGGRYTRNIDTTGLNFEMAAASR